MSTKRGSRVKIVSIFLTVIIVTLVFSGCSKNEGTSATGEGTVENKQPIKVAVVLSGFLGDKSFNDSAWEGVKRAQEEFGIEPKVLESKNPSDWESNLVAVASDNYDLVIAVSTQFQEFLEKHAPEFPNVKFALIDGVVNQPNVVSAVFAQNEGSFLAGAAAAMFTQKTNIPGVNSEKIIGWVGGMDIPVLHDFFVGYEQGAKYIDPEIKILQAFAGTFNDPLKGKELALAQFEQGADIVMNVASNTGNGVLEAASQVGKYAIGVDINQDDMYPGNILTSMLKRVDVATYLIIKDVVEGNFKGGTVLRLNVANGGVGLTDMSVIREAFKEKYKEKGDEYVKEIDEILQKIQQITEDIKNGKIVVKNYPGFKLE